MIPPKLSIDLVDRIHRHAREWRLTIEQSFESDWSAISFVTRDDQPLVLKVVKREGDEWRSGEVIRAFDGHGVVRVYEHTGGAMLLERLIPGTPLSNLALNGRDEEATEIFASVIEKMSPREPPEGCATVEDWGKGFARYLTSGDQSVSRPLVESAQQRFLKLCQSQGQRRLLHGDLHHYNVLDSERGWLAIDPKGVIGELEYEIGAILRNPFEAPGLFLSRLTIERRIELLSEKLRVDRNRVVAWAFSQAVLSAIWNIEDEFAVDDSSPGLRLAIVMRSMLGTSQ